MENIGQQLLELLNDANIPVVVLKGAAAAANYPNPEYRCMGDIDIIVLPEDFSRTYALLSSSGYTTEETLENFHRHIGFCTADGIEIELHSYFSTSSDKKQNEILDQYIFSGIANARVVDVCGYQVPILPPLENGLVLLGHINQHISGGLGLRQIVDWMYFVEKYLTDDYWEKSFRQAAKCIGMARLAQVTTAMCKKKLGLNAPAGWFCDILENPICDELTDYILSHGNFGRKNSTSAVTIRVIRWFRNPIRGLAMAQKTGCRTWNTLKKRPWLKPFAWLYQIARWISHGIKQGVTPTSALNAARAEDVETEFLRKLGITRLS